MPSNHTATHQRKEQFEGQALNIRNNRYLGQK